MGTIKSISASNFEITLGTPLVRPWPAEASIAKETGLDLPIQEGGANLSAGQRQLVAIARAVLRRSKFVLLDEATAALDEATDQAIQQTIRRCFEGASTLTIAHRMKTILDSHRIMVLQSGQIVEFGTPEELQDSHFAKEGIFRSMLQQSKS